PPGTERLVTAGEQGVILYSDDRGSSWQHAQSPVSVLLTALSFADARQGWAVGHDGTILHTADGGETWQVQRAGMALVAQQRDDLQQLIDNPPADASAQALDEWQYRLDDVQFALDDQAMPVLLDVLFIDDRHGFALGAYGALFETKNGGEQWSSIGYRLPNPDRLHLNAVLITRTGRLLIAGEAGFVVYSDDNGQHWQPSQSPYAGSLFGLSERDNLYLMGLRGHLFSSRDGVSWLAERTNVDGTLNGAIASPDALYVLGQGGLLLARTQDEFERIKLPQRRGFTAGVALDNRLWLVGEGGVSKVELSGGVQ
ncbi:MAG: photosystem I reaction center subunit IV, partial [Oceanospirillales bacterium]|nr:photosystem I reaction center subunit IV [Oceanospirillales bacterium]